MSKKKEKKFKPVTTMVKVNGKRFVCHCGAAVQTQIEEGIFVCNGCETKYFGGK